MQLRSEGSSWNEIDFEFLGNLSGDPYIVHTNVYTQGKGDREQQFYLWFDPTADFHTYSFLWNPAHVVWVNKIQKRCNLWSFTHWLSRLTLIHSILIFRFYVDGRPIREYRNLESFGIPYPKNQPMRLYSSLWNADDWATRGGAVKTDWSQAPFTASFQNFRANGCVWSNGVSSCKSNSTSHNAWLSQQLDSHNQKRLKWVQMNYMIYNYCTDVKRFPQGFPMECTVRTKS